MRFLGFIASFFPFLSDAATEADAAIGGAIDATNGRIDDAITHTGQGFADVMHRIEAIEAVLELGPPAPGPTEPPAGGGQGPDLGASTMAPTPAGFVWLVIPDTAQPQAGEVPGTRCTGYTPVPRELPAGFVLTLVPASAAPEAGSPES